MDTLKLIALDEADLGVISAHVQDSVLKVGDIGFDAGRRQFGLLLNRFVWETVRARRQKTFERRLCSLHFNRVGRVRSKGLDRGAADAVLSLLTIQFFPDGDDGSPGGEIELIFAGDVAVQLEVECIEVQLADLGPAWETARRPRHPENE